MKSFVGHAALAASLAFFINSATAGEALHSGSWTGQVTKQEVLPLGSQDHVLVAQVLHGTNKSTGTEPMADGAKLTLSETIELDKGNGPQHGYFNVADDKGSTTTAYEGKITTTMVDGKPRTTGAGTWRDVSATGAYKGAARTGTYSFVMTSPTDVMGEWKEDTATANR